MTIRPIQLLGSPALRAQCEPVSNARSPAVRVVADDLQETFRDLRTRHGYGRGLSAPQIGAPIRIVYIEVEDPLLLINPSIVDIGKRDIHVWDDCFSIPGLLVRVQRANRIMLEYEDLSGTKQQLEAVESLAELLQHEIEHLDGVLIVDHPVGLDPFCNREEWNKHYADAGKYSEPFDRDAGTVL